MVVRDTLGFRPCDSWYRKEASSANHWKVTGGLKRYRNMNRLISLYFLDVINLREEIQIKMIF